jgi:hypothetical protein
MTQQTKRSENQEFTQFNEAMNNILRADPKVVKQQMEEDAWVRAEARKAKRAADLASIDRG